MLTKLGGEAVRAGAGGSTGYTYINLDNPATGRGVIQAIGLYISSNVTGLKVGTFYGSSTSYTNRNAITLGNVSSGYQVIQIPDMAFESGDYIGLYFATGAVTYASASNGGVYYVLGDKFGAGTQTYTLLSGYMFSAWGLAIAQPRFLKERQRRRVDLTGLSHGSR